ncbi:nucleopolyhedrovirus P10 family protein [Streptomyces sp. NPDC026672]|uniref:nucleopolyhedrovirus P10 family protein n=1 Tax=unclassified Streptomyces TaxID=2593676 RepID=UPI0033F3D337
MTAESWTQAVRHHVGLGRLLPLGGPRDGAWITEAAAGAVLRGVAREVPGVRVGALRVGLAHPAEAAEPVVAPPPGALPPGALRLTADFAATAVDPLPETAERLRRALAEAAERRLGLAVTEVDLRVTALLDDGEPEPEAGNGAENPAEPVRAPRPPSARAATDADEVRAGTAALAVPGAGRLTSALGGLGRAVRVEERRGETSLAHRHVRVELTVTPARRALDVAGEVRAAVRDALPDRPTVTLLVTAVE